MCIRDRVIDDKLMEWLQKERCATQRCTVQPFALLVAKGFLNNADAELRRFMVYLIVWIFKVAVKSFH